VGRRAPSRRTLGRTEVTLPDIASVRSFYDDFSRQFLADFVHGNPRIEAAIGHCIRSIPRGTERVLDIGCGLGWSSHEIKRHFPATLVTGIDLSDTCVSLAGRLFQEPGLSYGVADVTAPGWETDAEFDVAMMCDVYEHIPAAARRGFNESLGRLLRPHARVVLAFPSAWHQNYLAERHPEGLQPVDETITEETMAELASDIGGRVESWQFVTIWNPGDYVHAVIVRGPGLTDSSVDSVSLEPPSDRDRRVLQRLGRHVTPDGLLIPAPPGPSVLIVSPLRGAYSETFIKAHMEQLPTRVEVLFGLGEVLDLRTADGEQLASRWERRLRRVLARWRRTAPLASRLDRFWLDRFLSSRDVRAVLAEYGPTGSAFVDACRRRRIPLITHFHGFDAYDRPTLTSNAESYRRLFRSGAAFIAVSSHMVRRLGDLGAPPDRVHLVPCGANLSRFEPIDPGANPPQFVTVGRFVEKKGQHVALLAMRRVIDQVADARFLLVGDGPLLDACRQLASALALDGAVQFTGALRPHEVAAILRGARGAIQPSLTAPSGDREGTPVALLEGCATGLPTVATRHGGIIDVIVDGESGILVEEGDVIALADGIIQLANDPELARRMGGAARLQTEARWSQAAAVEHLWEVVRAAMDEGEARERGRPPPSVLKRIIQTIGHRIRRH
jgi:colanic acid/amylovoran biosynthesis glycosyltransferase